jgi:serine protein kinase
MVDAVLTNVNDNAADNVAVLEPEIPFISAYKAARTNSAPESMSIGQFLVRGLTDPTVYENPHARLRRGIGKAIVIDTGNDPRMARIFGSKPVPHYKGFEEMYGREDTIHEVVGHIESGASDPEASNKIIVIIGPPGGGKTSVAEVLKKIYQKQSFYALDRSPINENPLAALDPDEEIEDPQENNSETVHKITVREYLARDFKVPLSAWPSVTSPMTAQKLEAAGNDINKIKVVKVRPSAPLQRGIAKVTPDSDGNIPDSALTGQPSQAGRRNDSDSYSFGALGFGNRGIVELAEMFKAKSGSFTPLLDPTSVGHYTTPIGPMPSESIYIAHCTPEEWEDFRKIPSSKSLMDRIVVVKVPHVLRSSEEQKIYEKLLRQSRRVEPHIAPETLRVASDFSVLTRLAPINAVESHNKNEANKHKQLPEPPKVMTSGLLVNNMHPMERKLRIYDGEDPKELDPKVEESKNSSGKEPEKRPYGLANYVDNAAMNLGGDPEGMTGVSARWMNKVLTKAFNAGSKALDPVILFDVLEKQIAKESFDKKTKDDYLEYINKILKPRSKSTLMKAIQTAYVESADDYGRDKFKNYFAYADSWIQDKPYRDDSDTDFTVSQLNAELEKIEKPMGIQNSKAVRNEIVNFVLRMQGSGIPLEKIDWRGNKTLEEMINKSMFSNTEELMPVITFNAKASAGDQVKHDKFVDRMVDEGYKRERIPELIKFALQP